MCVNNELYEQEALYWINRLEVPEGFSLDVLSIKDAKSMTSGYNEGMKISDAKYKIYMHQDVMLVNNKVLKKVIKVFENKKIGMIGVVGSPQLPDDKVMWHGKRVGMIYSSNVSETRIFCVGAIQDDYAEVEAIDGLFMATQYDIPWRDDIFDKWDFYDVSQSLEFKRAGYSVVVSKMDEPWCIHDDGYINLENYDMEREKLFSEYFPEEQFQ